MKRINLTEPFEKLSIAILSLPLTEDRISRTEVTFNQTKLKRLLREIYEAANGRQVATTIGLVAVAPPVAPYLKDKPFLVGTQADFLSQAMARIVDGTSKRPADVCAQPALCSTNSAGAQVRSRTPARTNDRQKDLCMRVA